MAINYWGNTHYYHNTPPRRVLTSQNIDEGMSRTHTHKVNKVRKINRHRPQKLHCGERYWAHNL